MGWVQQAQLIHGTLSKICLINFQARSSNRLLYPFEAAFESKVSIVVSHAGGLVTFAQRQFDAVA